MDIETGKIYNEDCIETMGRLNKGEIDLVVTSPPYDEIRKNEEYCLNIEIKKISELLFRSLKYGGIVVLITDDQIKEGNQTGTSFINALTFKEIGFSLYDTMIYEKDGSSFPHKNRYFNTFEYMFIFSKGKPKTVNILKDRKNKCAGMKENGITGNKREKDGSFSKRKSKKEAIPEKSRRTNVWKYNTGWMKTTKNKSAYDHPAIFPEKLAEDHIKSWSNKGDLVYDPFMGSGTTAVSCEKLNRKWFGSEISEEYCEIARERIKIERDQRKMF